MCTFRKWLNKILNQVHWTPELSHVTNFDHFFHNKLKSAFSIKYTWQTFDCLHSMVMSLKNETYLWNIIIRIRKNKKQNKLCLILKKKRRRRRRKKTFRNQYNKNSRASLWLSGKESVCQCRGHKLDPWLMKIPHTMRQLSPCTTTTETALQILGATATKALAPWRVFSATREVTIMRSLCTTTRG